jgi:hypothetical protein
MLLSMLLLISASSSQYDETAGVAPTATTSSTSVRATANATIRIVTASKVDEKTWNSHSGHKREVEVRSSAGAVSKIRIIEFE